MACTMPNSGTQLTDRLPYMCVLPAAPAVALDKLCSSNGYECWACGAEQHGGCPKLDGQGVVSHTDCSTHYKWVCRSKGKQQLMRLRQLGCGSRHAACSEDL